jgi:hypothetical protein
MGDREFQGVQLGKCLDNRGLAFILRQKKSTHTRLKESENYQALSELEPNRGSRNFFRGVTHTKSHQIEGFNLAIYWKRRYRSKGSKDPWYLLTNLKSLEINLKLYRAIFGIEAIFKDCKTGGYNLEKKVNEPRFVVLVLLIAISYSLNI